MKFSQLKRHSRGRRCPDPWIEVDWVPGHLPNNTYEYATYATYYEPGKLSGGWNALSLSLLIFKTFFRGFGVRGQ